MEFPVFKAIISEDLESDLGVDFIGLVDRPAIEKNFQVFNDLKEKVKFNVNEDKRIISGPAMVADLALYRNHKEIGEYYVVFDAATIQSIVEKFSAKGYLKNFNLFHDDKQQVPDTVIFNSFISNPELGIAPMAGFEDCPAGSWFISAKVNDDDTWGKVKSGDIKGFSIEGFFKYLPVAKIKMSEDIIMARIKYLLNQVEAE